VTFESDGRVLLDNGVCEHVLMYISTYVLRGRKRGMNRKGRKRTKLLNQLPNLLLMLLILRKPPHKSLQTRIHITPQQLLPSFLRLCESCHDTNDERAEGVTGEGGEVGGEGGCDGCGCTGGGGGEEAEDRESVLNARRGGGRNEFLYELGRQPLSLSNQRLLLRLRDLEQCLEWLNNIEKRLRLLKVSREPRTSGGGTVDERSEGL
jgi:hypothetical protein